MVPVFLATAPMVPHAVLAEEKQILRSEGWYHVRGLYFANSADADKMRRLEAERRVDEKRAREGREAQLRAGVVCAWCEKPIPLGEPAVIVAFSWVHAKPCAEEFEQWTADGPVSPPDPAGLPPALDAQLRKMLDDERWAGVHHGTPVLFDEEWTTWGALAQNEKMTCEFNDEGQLEGGYPI
jgi:hypothetical protein